ncbi:MAG: glutamine-hydrolyzing carbamoyl-phosphate synthase small subunit [Neisseriaceae bacterium]|nr:MAG: glutamine-hydrolyzing carbamoyl-phosphate synthase small subunit [Neisseriaceae bacterium]
MTEAVLVLSDGTVFKGYSIGCEGESVGEVVFNTSMTGYQEILTDPSYAQQLITLTYPHIGNVGVNSEDEESDKIFAKGLIIRSLSSLASNFRATDSLSEYLKKHQIVAISDIDTRHLTRIIRSQGSQVGAILTGEHIDIQRGIQLAKDFGSMTGKDLASEVTCAEKYSFMEGKWRLDKRYTLEDNFKYNVIVYDFGVKRNILRSLVARGCKLTVVPANTTAEDVLALNPDGIFLSNGPGDPEPCTYAIEAIKTFLSKNIPLFGICLGHQLLSLALGGKTQKMKFGHHGANHPVIDLRNNRVSITSQNHGFFVDEKSLPDSVEVTHRSLFDQSLQGIVLKGKPVLSFQGHPEASPGPQDIDVLFDQFIQYIENSRVLS